MSLGNDADSVQKIHLDEAEMEQNMNFVWEDLMDEAVLGLCFEMHRSVKLGTCFLDEMDLENEKQYEIIDEIGLDVFGQVPLKKQFECVCPNCQRSLAASRFAPHLEKCMGMGRNSSRIANKRIANSGKDAGSEDDENDDDWTYSSDRKNSKKKRDKVTTHSPRRTKSSKGKNSCKYEGDIPSVGGNASDSGSSQANCESMSIEERKALLVQMCGVISEHTKKMCTRSHRCPQHSDDQRKAVRVNLLGQQGALLDMLDDVHVDIDTYDDADSQAFRESMQTWAPTNSSSTSPADSNSTVNGGVVPRKKLKKAAKIGSSPKKKNVTGTLRNKLGVVPLISDSSSSGSNPNSSQNSSSSVGPFDGAA